MIGQKAKVGKAVGVVSGYVEWGDYKLKIHRVWVRFSDGTETPLMKLKDVVLCD